MFLSLPSEISIMAWAMAATAVFLMGASKAGLKGMSILNVTLMALAFGSKASTGIFMPLLIVGDIIAVIYYNRHTQWKYILKFIPWMVLGILVGVLVGKDLPEVEFKWGMVTVIFISLGLLYWWDRRKSTHVPTHWMFAGSMGIMAGICTMIGNLAGAFTNIFFLAMRLPKNQFVGTAAWLFFITNLFKLPFHIFVWKTVTMETLWVDVKLIPAILAGIYVGIRLVKIIREGFFRKMILVLTALGALLLLFR